MKLSVFGIGYVGCVSAACFANSGHDVTGVDLNATKVEIINSGKSPIVEAGIDELIGAMVTAGRLRATTNSAEAVTNSDVSLVCVGTPSNPNGSLDLDHVKHVCEEIGAALKLKEDRHTVVIRSTMLPGTVEGLVVPTLEESSGKRAGVDFQARRRRVLNTRCQPTINPRRGSHGPPACRRLPSCNAHELECRP